MRLATGPVNPVLARELRQRMRGPRAAVVITLYLLVLCAILQIMYAAFSRSTPGAEQVASFGESTFETLVFFVLLLVCFIVPGLTAGSVAGERERQTLVPLQVTLLAPRSILVGKMLASLAFVVLLIVATLPLVGVSFLLGGVEPLDVVTATAMVLVVTVGLACLSLACSTLLRRTQGATVMAYGVVLALTVGTLFAFGAQMLVTARGPTGRSGLILAPNPFMAVASVLDRGENVEDGRGASPFTPFQYLIAEREKSVEEGVDEARARRVIEVGPEGFPVTTVPDDVDLAVEEDEEPQRALLSRVPFWLLSLAAFGVLAAGSMVAASRRLAVPKATVT